MSTSTYTFIRITHHFIIQGHCRFSLALAILTQQREYWYSSSFFFFSGLPSSCCSQGWSWQGHCIWRVSSLTQGNCAVWKSKVKYQYYDNKVNVAVYIDQQEWIKTTVYTVCFPVQTPQLLIMQITLHRQKFSPILPPVLIGKPFHPINFLFCVDDCS